MLNFLILRFFEYIKHIKKMKKEANGTINRGAFNEYMSPCVKVLTVEARCVLCFSGQTQDYETEDINENEFE